MLLLLAVHLAMALAAPVLVSRLGRRAFFVLALAPASAAVWALSQTRAVLDGDGPTEVVAWVPALSIELAFRLDTLGWLMTLLVGGVGALVLVYCAAYFSASAGGLGRFGGVLVAFAGAMLGLVTTDDLLLLYVFWELTTVFSYLLIGHYSDRKASRRAAMQAIILTTFGGLAMLVGLVLLGEAGGSYRVSDVLADPPTGAVASVAVVLLLLGALSKSALVPLHFWLPAAMAAPTPVSAYLHAAAMVKAGVYLVARFAPAFADLPVWKAVVAVAGTWTLVHGGYRALRQYDLKLVLAFGTVSQLGLLVLLVGLPGRATALAGLAMLGAHAMFKASLFLVVGIVDAATGTRDLRRLTGVGRALPLTATAGALATLSMIGMFPFAGFVAKEAALEALLAEATTPSGLLVVVGMVVGSALTVAYGLRFWWGAFADKRLPATDDDGAPVEPPHVSRPSLVLVAPAAVLAVLGLVTGLLPGLGETLLAPHAAGYAGEEGHLVLWAGFKPAFWLTVLVLAAGAAMFAARAWVERAQSRVSVPLDADRAYRRLMRRLDDAAADVTALTQRGSLPFYLGVILLAMVALQTVALTRTGLPGPDEVRLYDRPAQLVVGGLAVAGAVLAANARRRLKAVVLAGVSGYGVAALFMLHGAPDLALTQVLVETVTLVVFVLVLRRLPAYFSVRPLAASRWLRMAIGVASGLVVGALALVVPTARVHPPVSEDFPEEAYVFGGGRNIVNVTLVDIRAWDTTGEIAVLLVAATGVASLIFLSTRSGSIFRSSSARGSGYVWDSVPQPAVIRRLTVDARAQHAAGTLSPGRNREWLGAGSTLAPQRRSVVFEIITRLLFHSMVVVGLYLLFAGHNSPGGGFAGGLVVGIALIVRYLAGGRYELGDAAPVHPGLLLGLGLFLSAGVGLVAVLAGGSLLQSVIIEFAVPVLGPIKLVTSVFFDIGVFLLVLGVVLDVLRSLGAEIDRHSEEAAPDSADPEVRGTERVSAGAREGQDPGAGAGTRGRGTSMSEPIDGSLSGRGTGEGGGR
ncbi:monovalent cation/H+ antiporter subunit A [Actinotalea ferrariae CF5-4]|uniref:Monovalent cation/H+ antiporter subunit A n=1 Tax=Actinotalea ferrariae CF5-4 TaxID=948458 RepID=A0A021VX19_9CELL|nr:Na+/H+ antiporter subunit A [Actinotalea ferrariae]EYR63622.1 monovalent cation/H+ antiporter subunit A [Actinotalea ferrariae CF5-4]